MLRDDPLGRWWDCVSSGVPADGVGFASGAQDKPMWRRIMRLYRCVSDEELGRVLESGFVYPKPFTANEHSTCPSGCWSFWFAEMVDLPGSAGIVEAEVAAPVRHSMTWGTRAYGRYEEFVCPEYITEQPIRALRVFSPYGFKGTETISILDPASLISISKAAP